jgi:hypothetical protein
MVGGENGAASMRAAAILVSESGALALLRVLSSGRQSISGSGLEEVEAAAAALDEAHRVTPWAAVVRPNVSSNFLMRLLRQSYPVVIESQRLLCFGSLHTGTREWEYCSAASVLRR